MNNEHSPIGTQQLLIQDCRDSAMRFDNQAVTTQAVADCEICKFHEAGVFDKDLGKLCLKCFAWFAETDNYFF